MIVKKKIRQRARLKGFEPKDLFNRQMFYRNEVTNALSQPES
jgi:hypothetical protein